VSIHVVGSGPWVARTSGGPSRDVARFLAQARHILRPVRWKKHLCLHSCLCLAIGPPRVSSDGRRAARHCIMLQPVEQRPTAHKQGCIWRPAERRSASVIMFGTRNIKCISVTDSICARSNQGISIHYWAVHNQIQHGSPKISLPFPLQHLASGWRPKGWHQTCRGCMEPQ